MVATVYLPIAVDDIPLPKNSQNSKLFRRRTVHGTPPDYPPDESGIMAVPTENIALTQKELNRRSLTIRWSKSLRRSWGSRSTRTSVDERETKELDCETTERVKSVSKIRDWSDELDEDDVYNIPRYRGRRENRIIWAEEPCDIGQFWNFITHDTQH
jgi:hypothetical protein